MFIISRHRSFIFNLALRSLGAHPWSQAGKFHNFFYSFSVIWNFFSLNQRRMDDNFPSRFSWLKIQPFLLFFFSWTLWANANCIPSNFSPWLSLNTRLSYVNLKVVHKWKCNFHYRWEARYCIFYNTLHYIPFIAVVFVLIINRRKGMLYKMWKASLSPSPDPIEFISAYLWHLVQST